MDEQILTQGRFAGWTFAYEGKAKRLYRSPEGDRYLVRFKDDATAFNGKKRGQIESKGIVNSRISSLLFRLLEEHGVETHLLEEVGPGQMLVRAVEIIPLEVVVRNLTTGSLSRRLGLPEGRPIDPPLVEFYYKSDALDDPLVYPEHAGLLGAAREEEVVRLRELALQVNGVLQAFFQQLRIVLVDFKLEFGRADGRILLADELSPDTCRFWEAGTGRKLDKDRFRQDLGQVEEAYQEMLRRVEAGATGRVASSAGMGGGGR
ncbi:phosphoribosylaminoimidazolesuccinocarboxamide synthase [Limnochorda pilosa]|uniref:Phosphoribosylaminoimidazole-succinocarboxamide synthase n=1 Tax=Limnochorda pilosa TaxID=1555112 RepID=A0A0K2SJX4_LIMPI|nr:phosphoribosylaminoimidazolesuccinocarboxamide synthase [Limnochorda pilosa]BAS27418.1 phosphoribosylaminoimidazole-succinocarboxamide synthase [Limnochorda pilosa]